MILSLKRRARDATEFTVVVSLWCTYENRSLIRTASSKRWTLLKFGLKCWFLSCSVSSEKKGAFCFGLTWISVYLMGPLDQWFSTFFAPRPPCPINLRSRPSLHKIRLSLRKFSIFVGTCIYFRPSFSSPSRCSLQYMACSSYALLATRSALAIHTLALKSAKNQVSGHNQVVVNWWQIPKSVPMLGFVCNTFNERDWLRICNVTWN